MSLSGGSVSLSGGQDLNRTTLTLPYLERRHVQLSASTKMLRDCPKITSKTPL